MKNTILLIGLIAILLVPFAIAVFPCPAGEDGKFFGEIVQTEGPFAGTILGDYDNDCTLGGLDVNEIRLAINGKLDCFGLNYHNIPYSLDINGDGICTDVDEWAISAKSVLCTDSDGDYYFVCINSPTISHDFGGTKDCNDNAIDINPGAREICGNEFDEDCDGILDNGCGTFSGIVYNTDNWDTLSGVTIILDDLVLGTFSTTSGEDGSFTIILPAGVNYDFDANFGCAYTYPSIIYPSLQLSEPIAITDGGFNEGNVYMDIGEC